MIINIRVWFVLVCLVVLIFVNNSIELVYVTKYILSVLWCFLLGDRKSIKPVKSDALTMPMTFENLASFGVNMDTIGWLKN